MNGSSVIDMMVTSANVSKADDLYDEVSKYAETLDKSNKLRYYFSHQPSRTIIVTDSRFSIQFLADHEYDKIPKDQRWRIIKTVSDTEFRDTYKSIINGLIDKHDEQIACDTESKKVKVNILYMMSNPDARHALKDFLDEVYQVTGVTANVIRNGTYMIGDYVCQITCVFKDGWMSDNLYKSDFNGIIIKPETLRTHHVAIAQVIRSFIQTGGSSDERS